MKWIELLLENGGRLDMHQLLFADDTALVANSEEKLCGRVSESDRLYYNNIFLLKQDYTIQLAK